MLGHNAISESPISALAVAGVVSDISYSNTNTSIQSYVATYDATVSYSNENSTSQNYQTVLLSNIPPDTTDGWLPPQPIYPPWQIDDEEDKPAKRIIKRITKKKKRELTPAELEAIKQALILRLPLPIEVDFSELRKLIAAEQARLFILQQEREEEEFVLNLLLEYHSTKRGVFHRLNS